MDTFSGTLEVKWRLKAPVIRLMPIEAKCVFVLRRISFSFSKLKVVIEIVPVSEAFFCVKMLRSADRASLYRVFSLDGVV